MARLLIFLLVIVVIDVSLLAAEPLKVTHGPILGRVGSDYIGIWVRTSRPGEFQIRYGTQKARLDRLSKSAMTELVRDNTGWVLIDGLAPGEKYYYEVVIPSKDGSLAGPGGSFRTLPDMRVMRDAKVNPRGLFNFQFEFACGNQQRMKSSGLFQPVFDTMLREIKDEIDFAILNGDWLYEEQRDYPVDEWVKQVGIQAEEIPELVRIAPNIAGVWQNYKLYLERGKSLAEWHRNMPSFFVYDDHEILDDVRGTGSVGFRDHRAVFRDIGVQGWYDYLGWSNPVESDQPIVFGRARLKADSDILSDSQADFSRLNLDLTSNLHVHWGGPTAWRKEKRFDGVGGHPDAGVYEIMEIVDKNRLRIRPRPPQDAEVSYSIGRLSYFQMGLSNCDFFVLDTRGQREMPIQAQPDRPGQSILGARQKAWLKKAMRESNADFIFVVSSVNLVLPHILDVGETGPDTWSGQHDSWTGFPEERKEMIQFWDSLDKPIFILTGDLHNSFAVKVTDNLWEFASGPHSSGNASMLSEGERPSSGPFEYQGVKFDIRWSTYQRADSRGFHQPVYCVVQVNNVFNNPARPGKVRWVAFDRPHVVFQYYDGLTGRLLYAEAASPRLAD